MFKTAQDLKQFILWCKSQKVKAFKNDNIQFELSDIAFIETEISMSNELKDIDEFDSKTLVDTDTESDKEDEDLLYWSSN